MAIEWYIAFYSNDHYQEKLGGLAPLEFRELLMTVSHGDGGANAVVGHTAKGYRK